MGDLLQFCAPEHDITAMVRVAGANGATHFASVRAYDRRRGEEKKGYRTPSRLVTHCLVRLEKPGLALGAVTCSSCTPHVGRFLDVTDELLAGAIA